MEITREPFGKAPDGQEVYLYTLQNSHGMQAKVTNLGATLVALLVPGKDGSLDDVVLGYDSAEEYANNGGFLGATVGRNANRIAGAKVCIDGVEYALVANENGNNLHTDKQNGLHRQVWQVKTDEPGNRVTFSYTEADMATGFPGKLDISVSYTLMENDAIAIDYAGVSDKKTIINMTNHSYFNLSGHDAGSIEDTKLMLKAAHYTPVAFGAIPTGEIAPVAGTPMDFTSLKRIGEEINADFEQLKLTGGYDHNWALDGESGRVRKIAEAVDEASGRIMEVSTDLPGVQFYAGNGLSDVKGKGGVIYHKRGGFCLETQYFPNSANEPAFESPMIDAGQEYRTTTIYQFRY